jgi:hypothetical protein
MADMRVLLLTSLFNTDFFDNALPSKNSAFDSIKRFNCAKRIDRCNVQTLVFLCREIKCLGIPCTKLLEAIFKHQRMHACTYHFQTEAKIWTLELCTLCRYNVITLQKVLCYFFERCQFFVTSFSVRHDFCCLGAVSLRSQDSPQILMDRFCGCKSVSRGAKKSFRLASAL